VATFSDRVQAGLSRTVPALPVRDVSAAAADYRDRFGFEVRLESDRFAVLVRDDAAIHLWGAVDEDWRSRDDLADRPICSGAESFLAGTGSCRIEVSDVDALYGELRGRGVLHDVSREGVTSTDYGSREFATVDCDGNLLTFYRFD
jgi:catechol 2,3-dioxygenase-like lactoylglutathione lyase family enzyme